MIFLAAIGRTDDAFRKPNLNMFLYLEKELNGGKKFDRDASFFCGDAAGRKQVEATKRDFSADDLLFAKALGVKFYTPELYYFGKDDRMNENGQKLEKAHQVTGQKAKSMDQ